MKAFIFADLHASSRQLYNLKEYLKSDGTVNFLIFAGDVVNGGEPIGFVNSFIEALEEIGLPFFWVPGNNDFGRSYHKLNAKYPSLEGKIIDFNGMKITGVGGSPASWAGQYAGEKMIDKKYIAGSIFVSHTPPPGLLTIVKDDVASQQYNSGITKHLSDSPLVHICGHFHSRWGCGYLGATKVINPGSLADGRYVIMDADTLKVEFRRFDYGNSYRV